MPPRAISAGTNGPWYTGPAIPAIPMTARRIPWITTQPSPRGPRDGRRVTPRRAIRPTFAPPIPTNTVERVAVLIDGESASGLAVRRAADLAASLHGPFIAVVPDLAAAPERDHLRARTIREDIEVATDLGGTVVRVDPAELAGQLIDLLRRRQVTHLVVAHRPPTRLERLRGPSLVDLVAAAVPDLEIHLVVAHDAHGGGAKRPPSGD